jgi:hypothetical protein
VCACVRERDRDRDKADYSRCKQVDLCGHATLASAHLLFASGIVLGYTVLFNTKSGVLKATKVSGYEEYEELPEEEDELGKRPERRRPGGKGVVQLDFPLVPAVPCNDTFLLSEALGGVAIKWAGETSLGDYLVELSNCELVKQQQQQQQPLWFYICEPKTNECSFCFLLIDNVW